MKRLFAVAVLALILPGCGSLAKGELRIGRGGTSPSFETVVGFLKLNDEAGAKLWLLRKGLSEADADELLVKAKVEIERQRAECTGQTVCP